MIKVVDGKFQTLVVDLGRYRWYWQGLPPSGPMDLFSFMMGNILLGNSENAAGLECCYEGPILEIMSEACVAFTGAEVNPLINNGFVPMWEVHKVKPGDIISFQHLKCGRWFYVSVSGGIDVPVVFGSRTTYLAGRLGGYKGRGLKKGDILRLFPPTTHLSKVAGVRLEDKYIPPPSKYNEVRTVFGLLQHSVSNMDEFTGSVWKLSRKDSRIGYRFYSQGFAYRWARQERGEAQPFGAGQDPCNAIIGPYPVGSIQTDMRNGAIILLQDAVSQGGYITLGTVIQCDQDILAQARPGDEVKFIPITREEALSVRKEKFEILNRIREFCLRL